MNPPNQVSSERSVYRLIGYRDDGRRECICVTFNTRPFADAIAAVLKRELPYARIDVELGLQLSKIHQFLQAGGESNATPWEL
jgi:histone acetyltransferase (RNA polymerase elongator complex component)